MKSKATAENQTSPKVRRPSHFWSRKWPYLIVFIFGAILTAGIWAIMWQIMTGDDYAFHIMRLQSASKAWSNGQVIPQVDPDALNGFGYAYNLFYGPLATYVAAGLQALIGAWPIVINLILIGCLIGGGLTMCYTMMHISKNTVLSTLVAVFYMAAPYTLNNLYARMALGEVVAFVAAPILLLGLWQLTTKQKHAARSIALSATLLILSHSLSAMLFALMASIYILLNIRKLFNWENIWHALLGTMTAIGLTAFFTLPLIEAKLIGNYGVFDQGYAEVYFGANPQSMNDHRIWPQQLLLSDYSGKVNAEGLGGEFGITLGLIALVGLIGFWFIRNHIEDNDQRHFVTSLYIISILAILLALPVVNWYYMPGILWQMQFSWRALMVSTITLSVVSGYTFYGIIRNWQSERQRVAAIIIGLLAIYLVMPLIMPRADRHKPIEEVANDPVVVGWEAEYSPMQLLCSAENDEEVAQGYACSLTKEPELLAERGTEPRIVSGTAKFTDFRKDGLRATLNIETPDNHTSTKLELPMIYYPGYQATLDGNAIRVASSEKYGMVEVEIPASTTGELKIWYGLSRATKYGTIISLGTLSVSIIWLGIATVIEHRERKKNREMANLIDSVRKVVEDETENSPITNAVERAETKEDLVTNAQTPEISETTETTKSPTKKKTATTKVSKATKAKASARTNQSTDFQTKSDSTTESSQAKSSAKVAEKTATPKVTKVKAKPRTRKDPE